MDFALYQPPARNDYDNVRMLNAAWLAASTDFGSAEIEQLARTPFLLFSLREQDPGWWAKALERQHDLLDAAATAPAAIRRIQSAAIGFLWHLAERNAYAVRLISGASVSWCEVLTAEPLITVIDRVGERADLIRSRLDIGAVNEPCGQLAALQQLLSEPQREAYREKPAAACQMPSPACRVSDKPR